MTSVYGRNRLSWKKDTLHFEGNPVMSIIADKTYVNMFRVLWPDGTHSADYYNRTRAKEHSVRVYLQELNKDGLDLEYSM